MIKFYETMVEKSCHFVIVLVVRAHKQDTYCGAWLILKNALLKQDSFMVFLHLCHSAQIFEP